jgi:biotin transport system substrate-specific component
VWVFAVRSCEKARVELQLLEGQRRKLGGVLREVVLLVVGVVVLGVSSKASFYLPISPVPFTLQTLVLTYLILLLGRKAWRVVATYILGGLARLPLFALGGGPWYVLSPTFGYLLGFLAGALIGGSIISGRSLVTPRKVLASATASTITIYALGALHLTIWYVLFGKTSVTNALTNAVITGILPFIPWDALKAYTAAGLYIATNKAITCFKHK